MFNRQEGTSEGKTSNRTKRGYAKIVPKKVIPFYLIGEHSYGISKKRL